MRRLLLVAIATCASCRDVPAEMSPAVDREAVSVPAPPPRLPACEQPVSLSAMDGEGAPEQHFQYFASWVADRLVVAAREEKVFRLAEYRPATNAWHATSTQTLEDLDDVLPAISASATHVVIAFDTKTTKQVAVYDVAAASWSRVPTGLDASADFYTYLLGDRLVVVPRPQDSCGFFDWERAAVIELGSGSRHALANPPAGGLWQPNESVPVGARLLLWGGERVEQVVDTPDCEQPNPRVVDETWLLDAEAGTWRQVSGGPSHAPLAVSVATGHTVALVAGTAVWRFDLAGAKWTELGATGRSLFPADPKFASLWAEAVSGRASIFRIEGSGAEGVVVDRDGTVRTLERGFGGSGATAVLALDERLVVLPKDPAQEKRVVYVLDTRDATWCELEWPVPDSMWREEGSRYFRAAFVHDGRGYLFGPEGGKREGGGKEEGVIVDLPRW